MAEKKRTEKQLANDQRLRDRGAKMREEKLLNDPVANPAEQSDEALEDVQVHNEAPEADPRDELMAKMWAEIESLKANQKTTPTPEAVLTMTAQMTGANIGANGIQGIQFKYPVDKGFYPDPTDDLYELPSLRRFAMRENYLFVWDVEGVTYESHNVTYAEPRFIVELHRLMFDRQGNLTGQKMFVGRMYLHEDEFVARIVADKLKITDQFESHEDMMNQVRLYRFKEWLTQLFFPEEVKARQASFQTVVDGKVVTITDTEEFTDAEAGKSLAGTIQREAAI